MSDQGSDDIGPRITPPVPSGPIPPWQDMRTLCRHISCSPDTVNNWVAQGILPQPRKRGGELMWKWSEVDDYLTHGGPQAADIDRIRQATRLIVEETPRLKTTTIENNAAAAPTLQDLRKDIEALVDQAARSRTLFVTEAELIQRLGVPDQLAQAILQDFDANHPALLEKQKVWGDRRYWPAVKAWLDKTCGLELAKPRPRKSGRSKVR